MFDCGSSGADAIVVTVVVVTIAAVTVRSFALLCTNSDPKTSIPAAAIPEIRSEARRWLGCSSTS
jgi:hypothetical protein